MAASLRFPEQNIDPLVDDNWGYIGTYSGMVADYALRELAALLKPSSTPTPEAYEGCQIHGLVPRAGSLVAPNA